MNLDPPGPELEAFRSDLLAFYADARRDLPWRRDRDPYRVLVSEVMLQQTRVETVVPYFERWMERFPDADALAEAETEEVLRLWQGLGYYRRARNLHRAVREVGRRYGGRIPRDPSELETLPGVGPYTAGAVASIAFGVPAPAVDGNVRRVLSRLRDEPAPTAAMLRRWAAALVDPDRPGEFNQALMELGATICTPARPACGACPVAEHCLARRHGTQEERPRRRRSSPTPEVVEAVAALVDRTDAARRVLLRRRPDEGLLAGMWEIPGERVADPEQVGEAAARLAADLHRHAGGSGRPPTLVRSLESVDHAFSHLRIRYRPFLFATTASRAAGAVAAAPGDSPPGIGDDAGRALRWVALDELHDVPLPAAQTRILSFLS